MKEIENSPEIAQFIIEGLIAFANEEKKRPSMVVLWVEPEHGHCGLYITTMGSANLGTPAEFEYPNYRTSDILMRQDPDEDTEPLGNELIEIAKMALSALSDGEAPNWFGVPMADNFLLLSGYRNLGDERGRIPRAY